MTRSGRSSLGQQLPRTRRESRGFSLLEVIVAIAILGLGLTSILSAQAGLFSSSARGANMTRASNLARCKMSEVELKLLRDGFPLTDQKDDGHCCENEDDDGFTCKWTVETVKLPEMGSLDGGVDGGPFGGVTGSGLNLGGGLKMDASFNPSNTSGLNAFSVPGGAIPGMGPSGSSDPFGSSSSSGTGLGGIASMALTLVYPTVKPMLEASIRRVSVSVKWNEGVSERTFDVAQYLTNPQQGGMLPGMPGFIPSADEVLGGQNTTGAPASTTTTGVTK